MEQEILTQIKSINEKLDRLLQSKEEAEANSPKYELLPTPVDFYFDEFDMSSRLLHSNPRGNYRAGRPVRLFQIKALRDIPSSGDFKAVRKGELGGWIQSTSCLDLYDDTWVYEGVARTGKTPLEAGQRIDWSNRKTEYDCYALASGSIGNI